MLRLSLKSLGIAVYNSLEDHHLEVAYHLWENSYHGILSDDGEFAFFSPPRLFSAHDLKLSFSQELETTEYDLDQVCQSMDVNPNRFGMVASLLGCHILTSEDLSEFHRKLVPELKSADEGKYKIGFDRVIRGVVNYVRALPSIDDYTVISRNIFGDDKDSRKEKLQQSVKYFNRGTKESHGTSIKKAHKSKLNIPVKEEEDLKSKSKQETDYVVERIALDLDKLDITVQSDSAELDLVQAVASGMDIVTAEGKYPATKSTVKPIKIPKPLPDVRKTATERHKQGQMSIFVYQILTKGEIKLPVVLESDLFHPIHTFYLPLRQRVYGILCNLHHARFDQRTFELKAKKMRQKADELRKNAKKLSENDAADGTVQAMKEEATKLMAEASEVVLPDLAEFVIREWQPYNDYKSPLAVEATELPWPAPTVQRLWFGTSAEDKQKRLQAFLSVMQCESLPHSKVVPHLIIMATVLR